MRKISAEEMLETLTDAVIDGIFSMEDLLPLANKVFHGKWDKLELSEETGEFTLLVEGE